MLHNIFEGSRFSAAYRMGDYKLIWGYPGSINGWYLEDGTSTEDSDFAYTGTDDYYLFDLVGQHNNIMNAEVRVPDCLTLVNFLHFQLIPMRRPTWLRTAHTQTS